MPKRRCCQKSAAVGRRPSASNGNVRDGPTIESGSKWAETAVGLCTHYFGNHSDRADLTRSLLDGIR
eukprot:7999146-Pyramimonas_sp.AAC.1